MPEQAEQQRRGLDPATHALLGREHRHCAAAEVQHGVLDPEAKGGRVVPARVQRHNDGLRGRRPRRRVQVGLELCARRAVGPSGEANASKRGLADKNQAISVALRRHAPPSDRFLGQNDGVYFKVPIFRSHARGSARYAD